MKKTRRSYVSSAVEDEGKIPHLTVIPNVVRAPADVPKREVSRRASRVLFVGALDFDANVDALTFFVEEILPIARRSVSNFTLQVVGRSPIKQINWRQIESLSKHDGVRFAFDAPDLTSFYSSANAAIAPIRHGGGMKLKIIEAFANRCPVVTTVKGCEGLNVSDNKEVLIADTPEAFASACLSLIEDPKLAEILAHNAFTCFEKHYSQKVVDHLIEIELTSLMSVSRPKL